MQNAPILTDWAQLVDTNSPLPEYPRLQMVRAWLNLNGLWQFEPGVSLPFRWNTEFFCLVSP